MQQRVSPKIKTVILTANGTEISWDKFIVKEPIKSSDNGKALRPDPILTADGGSVLLDIPSDKNPSFILDFVLLFHEEQEFEDTVVKPARDGAFLKIYLADQDDVNKITLMRFNDIRLQKINQETSYTGPNPYKVLYSGTPSVSKN